MFCQKCGNQVADNARFCSGCGTPIAGDDSVQQTSIIKEKAKQGAEKVKAGIECLPFRRLAEEKIPAGTRAKFPLLDKVIPFTNQIVCSLAVVLVAVVIGSAASGGGGSRGRNAGIGGGSGQVQTTSETQQHGNQAAAVSVVTQQGAQAQDSVQTNQAAAASVVAQQGTQAQNSAQTNQSALSGTYTAAYFNYSIRFEGNTFTGSFGDTALSGTYAVTGRKITFNDSSGIAWDWYILNEDFIMDHENDIWHRISGSPAQFQPNPNLGALSGVYYFGSDQIAFSENTFRWESGILLWYGIYSVNGNTVILFRAGGGGRRTENWTIVDADTIRRDSDGNIWRKPAPLNLSVLSGRYYKPNNISITFLGNTFTIDWGPNITASSGNYSILDNRLTLNITGGRNAGETLDWTIVDANTLRERNIGQDLWRKE